MTDIFYDIDLGTVVTSSGAAAARVPELFYQEHTAWRIVLKRGSNAADISGVVAWGAAVAADFCAVTPPMCRTLAENITADVAAGAVTVALDCATGDFLAAVNGTGVKPAWFELYGLDAEGRRIVEVCFEIRARMTLDPDPAVDVDTPETVATKTYTQLAISGAIVESGLATSADAQAIADQQIADSRLVASSGARMIAKEVMSSGGGVLVVTSSTATSASIPVLSGGTSYIFTHPLTSLSIGSVANTTKEDRIKFTLASGGNVDVPPGCDIVPKKLWLHGGENYTLAVVGGQIIAADFLPGVTQ